MSENQKVEPWPVNAQPNPPDGPKVYAAIAKVMADVGKAGISKGRKNEQQNYKFRGIDDVYNALSGFLSAVGLCILPRVMKREVTERATKSGGVLFYVVLDVEFDLVCAEDGSKHTVAVVGEAMDSGDKATNKAMSAAYKYACMEVFCIPTEGNPDADQETHEVAAKEIPLSERSEAIKGAATGKAGNQAYEKPHTPIPDSVKNVDSELAQAAAKRMAFLLDEDVSEEKKAMNVADEHDKIKSNHDLYIAASQLLPASKRNAWKAYVKLAAEAERADLAKRTF